MTAEHSPSKAVANARRDEPTVEGSFSRLVSQLSAVPQQVDHHEKVLGRSDYCVADKLIWQESESYEVLSRQKELCQKPCKSILRAKYQASHLQHQEAAWSTQLSPTNMDQVDV